MIFFLGFWSAMIIFSKKSGTFRVSASVVSGCLDVGSCLASFVAVVSSRLVRGRLERGGTHEHVLRT